MINLAKNRMVDIVWHTAEEGYSFASVYIPGPINRAYARGDIPARYPLPALHVDSIGNLGERWSSWVDSDASYGVRW